VGNRKFWIVIVVLLVPLIPFLLLGHWLEPWIEAQLSDVSASANPWWTAVAIVLGLAVDILLPIPSSVLLVFAGRSFGGWSGAAVGWLGLNLSAAFGFWGSRRFGQPIVERFSSSADVGGFESIDARIGWWSLVACRPLPILAEASVIFAGLSEMRARRFWPPIIFANGIIAALYAMLGDYAARQQWFSAAVIASMVLPLLFIVVWRWRQRLRR
jgi:uncharacterized membrane protein YdjX (TVP38/TMEM64 family)